MACPQLRVESTGESLFWSLPYHSSGCKIPTCPRLTKSRQLAQGPQDAEDAEGRQDAENAQDCNLDQWYKAKGVLGLPSLHTCQRSRCSHPCTELAQSRVVGHVHTHCNS